VRPPPIVPSHLQLKRQSATPPGHVHNTRARIQRVPTKRVHQPARKHCRPLALGRRAPRAMHLEAGGSSFALPNRQPAQHSSQKTLPLLVISAAVHSHNTHTLFHTHTLSHTHSLTHTLSHTHTLTHTLSHTLTQHTHSLTHMQRRHPLAADTHTECSTAQVIPNPLASSALRESPIQTAGNYVKWSNAACAWPSETELQCVMLDVGAGAVHAHSMPLDTQHGPCSAHPHAITQPAPFIHPALYSCPHTSAGGTLAAPARAPRVWLSAGTGMQPRPHNACCSARTCTSSSSARVCCYTLPRRCLRVARGAEQLYSPHHLLQLPAMPRLALLLVLPALLLLSLCKIEMSQVVLGAAVDCSLAMTQMAAAAAAAAAAACAAAEQHTTPRHPGPAQTVL